MKSSLMKSVPISFILFVDAREYPNAWIQPPRNCESIRLPLNSFAFERRYAIGRNGARPPMFIPITNIAANTRLKWL